MTVDRIFDKGMGINCLLSGAPEFIHAIFLGVGEGGGGRVAPTLVFCYVVLIISLSFYPLSFVHYIVRSSSKYFAICKFYLHIKVNYSIC
jgi:hypothetical protein